MKDTKTLASAALASVLAVGLMAAAHAGPAAKPAYDFEKCYGIVKAGKNDCQTMSSSCAGTSKTDMQADAWVYLPKGSCERIAGGSTTPKG